MIPDSATAMANQNYYQIPILWFQVPVSMIDTIDLEENYKTLMRHASMTYGDFKTMEQK